MSNEQIGEYQAVSSLSPISNLQSFSNLQSLISPPQSPIPNLQSLISQSQQAQAMALQTAIEHQRRRKGETGGLCLWQFNEPWPAISWAIVDYFGCPKLAYELLKQWYNPILISLKFPIGRLWQPGEHFTAQIWAINDTLQTIRNAQLEITLDDATIHTQMVSLPANSTYHVNDITITISSPPRLILTPQRRNPQPKPLPPYLARYRPEQLCQTVPPLAGGVGDAVIGIIDDYFSFLVKSPIMTVDIVHSVVWATTQSCPDRLGHTTAITKEPIL